MTRIFCSLLFAFAVALAATACGGRAISATTDGGNGTQPGENNNNPSDDGGPDDPSQEPGSTKPGSPFPICPGSEPKPGWSCPTPHQGCVYVNVQKNTCSSLTCDENHRWQVSTPAGC
jgi:hypothetical protein